MVLPALLAVTALAVVIVALHVEQRTPTPAPPPDWVVRLEQVQSVAELRAVPLPRVIRGLDPVAVQAVIARAVELSIGRDEPPDATAGDPEGDPGGGHAGAAHTDGTDVTHGTDGTDVGGSTPSGGAG